MLLLLLLIILETLGSNAVSHQGTCVEDYMLCKKLEPSLVEQRTFVRKGTTFLQCPLLKMTVITGQCLIKLVIKVSKFSSSMYNKDDACTVNPWFHSFGQMHLDMKS